MENQPADWKTARITARNETCSLRREHSTRNPAGEQLSRMRQDGAKGTQFEQT